MQMSDGDRPLSKFLFGIIGILSYAGLDADTQGFGDKLSGIGNEIGTKTNAVLPCSASYKNTDGRCRRSMNPWRYQALYRYP